MFKINKTKYQKIKQKIAIFAFFSLTFSLAWAASLAQGQEISAPKDQEEIFLISLHMSELKAVAENVFITIYEVSVVQSNPVEPEPEEKVFQLVSQGRVIVTAYSSTPDQTDSTPFITANGTYVHDGVLACNFLPFGAKVRFPEYSGDKIYTVHDRMAKKNSHKMDIWMETRYEALQFGVRYLAYEVVK